MILLLVGCLESLLEAPYILTAGLPPVHSLSRTTEQDLLAATDAGVYRIDGDGAPHLVSPARADQLTAHGDRLYALTGQTLSWSPYPVPADVAWASQPAPPGTRDLQAWCDDTVLLATDSGLSVWTPLTGAIAPLPWPGGGAEQVTLPVSAPCDTVLVAAGGRIEQRTASGTVILAAAEQVRALAVAHDGSIWAIHGSPPVLGIVEDGAMSVRARHLGDSRDLQFGGGGLWDPRNAYLASGAGRIDYAQVHTAP